mgnify:CR=1 FL=1
MGALWRGSWTTKARIITGLILFVYVLAHFLNISLSLAGRDAADAVQQVRLAITRTYVGTFVLYAALLVHAALSLGKVALSARLRLSWVDVTQVGFGIAIPLLLASHIVFTRGSFQQFGTNDTVTYLAGLIWGTSSAWQQVALLLITWVHGCIGLHMWLRVWPGWVRYLPLLSAVAALIPAFAVVGFVTEGRRAAADLTGDEDQMLDFMDATNWPGPGEFAILNTQTNQAFWVAVALLSLALVAYAARMATRPKRTLKISYAGGPTISVAPGPTLLEMSQAAGVPHTALCGGRGRCTTCRVLIEDSAGDLPPPSEAERKTLDAVQAAPSARLACQLRPASAVHVYRVFQPDGRRARAHASQGKEAQLAILFLDMRGYTARTTGQLPYDVVFLLNRFFDAIVPAINAAGGTVDKYLGDGLLAVFEKPSAAVSAQAALHAARGIGQALETFNAQITSDSEEEPIRIGLSLHLGTLVLGEIGAAGQAPRTLIGDTVNTASRLEAETKALQVEALFSQTLLDAADQPYAAGDLISLRLRGVANPVSALPIAQLSRLKLRH